MIFTKKFFYGLFALIAITCAIVLFFFTNQLRSAFTFAELFSYSSPIGVFAIFGLLILGSIYLFGLAARILKETVK